MGHANTGLWTVLIVNTVVILLCAVGLYQPSSRRDWRAMGMFSAFIVALFVEMYGFPLTVYLLSAWLGSHYPGLTISQGGGHLWADLIGWHADPRLSPFHLASYVAIAGGFALIGSGWRVLWQAHRTRSLATTGLYARLRHPQYAGFLLIMVGFLLQWPTLATVVVFPVLVRRYWRLALVEEAEVSRRHGTAWELYASHTPRLIPSLVRRRHVGDAVPAGAHAEPRSLAAASLPSDNDG
jgi:protein-S-isoprenylcysteine O-methyltransferase Ste14